MQLRNLLMIKNEGEEEFLEEMYASLKDVVRRNSMVLDIGIGSGENTMRVLKELRPLMIIGIDADSKEEVDRNFDKVVGLDDPKLCLMYNTLLSDFIVNQKKDRFDLVVLSSAIHYTIMGEPKVAFERIEKIINNEGFFLVKFSQLESKSIDRQSIDSNDVIDELDKKFNRVFLKSLTLENGEEAYKIYLGRKISIEEKALIPVLEHLMSIADIDAYTPNSVIKLIVEKVGNMRIEIYSRDHEPPHFHVKSKDGSINAKFAIEDCKFLGGEISPKDKRRIELFHKEMKAQIIWKIIWDRRYKEGKTA